MIILKIKSLLTMIIIQQSLLLMCHSILNLIFALLKKKCLENCLQVKSYLPQFMLINIINNYYILKLIKCK